MAGCKPIVISSWILLFLLILLTEAAFYPTKPIANTTYVAGQAALVTWVEDGVEPHISSLGRMTIDLYAGRNVSSVNWTTAYVRAFVSGASRGTYYAEDSSASVFWWLALLGTYGHISAGLFHISDYVWASWVLHVLANNVSTSTWTRLTAF